MKQKAKAEAAKAKVKAKASASKASAKMKTAAAKAKVAEVKKGGAVAGKTGVSGDRATVEQMVAEMRDNVMMQQQEQDMRLNTMTQKIMYVKRVLMGILNGGGSTGGDSTKPKINVSVNGQPQNAMMGAQADTEADFENMEEGETLDGLDMFADIGVDELWDM